MVASFVASELNAMADAEAARIGALSLHTADPAFTGASEAPAGAGTPPYARKAVTFNAAGTVGPLGATAQPATPGKAWSSQATFDVTTATFTHFGCWSTVTGTYRSGNALAAAQTVAAGVQTQILVSIAVGPVAGA